LNEEADARRAIAIWQLFLLPLRKLREARHRSSSKHFQTGADVNDEALIPSICFVDGVAQGRGLPAIS
jgi:hypothetical protein